MIQNKNTDLLARRGAAITNGVGLTHPVLAQRAENSEIWDAVGKRFTDFAAGIAVTNCGDRHPAIVAAVTEQLEAFTHTCQHVAPGSIGGTYSGNPLAVAASLAVLDIIEEENLCDRAGMLG